MRDRLRRHLQKPRGKLRRLLKKDAPSSSPSKTARQTAPPFKKRCAFVVTFKNRAANCAAF